MELLGKHFFGWKLFLSVLFTFNEDNYISLKGMAILPILQGTYGSGLHSLPLGYPLQPEYIEEYRMDEANYLSELSRLLAACRGSMTTALAYYGSCSMYHHII